MTTDLGLLLVRLTVGYLMFGHGAMKLFGWFGGPGLKATTALMGSQLRLRPAALWTPLAGLTEVGGGILFGIGLFQPLGSLGIVAAMFVASFVAHPGKLWAQKGGMEYPLTNLVIALAVGLIGSGAYSLDAILGIALPEPLTLVVGLVLVAIGVGILMVTRAPLPSPAVPSKESVASRS